MTVTRRMAMLGLVMSLSACSTYHSPVWGPDKPMPPAKQSSPSVSEQPVSPKPESTVPKTPPAAVPAPVVKNVPLPSAAKAVLANADQLADQGRPREAIAQTERALRMAPRSPEVYLAMGKHYQSLGDYGRAEQFSLRAVALAAGQPDLVNEAWMQVASIRERAGNSSGAADARARASQ